MYKYRTGCRFGLSRAACAVATRSATSKTSGIMESVSWMVAATSYPLTQGMESNGRPRQRARSSGSVESENNRDRMMKSRNRSVAAAACFQPPVQSKRSRARWSGKSKASLQAGKGESRRQQRAEKYKKHRAGVEETGAGKRNAQYDDDGQFRQRIASAEERTVFPIVEDHALSHERSSTLQDGGR